MTRRSIFLPGDSFNDVMDALNKANSPEERKRFIWERMKKNGCTHESETKFRQHCHTCSIILPDEAGKANPLARNPIAGANARLLADAVKNDFRQSKIIEGEME